MSDHVGTVSRIYEAFSRGDVGFILGTLADDVRWEEWENNYAQTAGVPWLRPGHGPGAARQFFEVIGGFDFKSFEVLSLLAGGNQVAAEVRLEIVVRATGARMREEEMHLWTFDAAGKVVRFRHYADTAKHIDVAGLVAPRTTA